MYNALFVATSLIGGTLAQKGGGCSPLELIYARATTEPTGFGFAGNALVSKLRRDLPGATTYAVQYPASMDLNGGGCKGVRDVVRRLEEKSKACPNQLYALGGHSQGGAVVTEAIKAYIKKGSDIEKRIVAVTMFGAPPCTDFPEIIEPARCKSFCNKGDDICDPGPRGKFQPGGPRVKCSGGGGAVVGKAGKGKGKSKGAFVLTETNNSTFPGGGEFLFTSGVRDFEKRQVGKGGKGGKGGKLSGGSGSNGCGDIERGHSTGSTGLAAHIAYASNGYYITSASCFIKKKFEERRSSSAGGAAAPASSTNEEE